MSSAKIILELVHAAGVGIGSRRDAQNALERSLQMKRTLVKFGSESGQRKRFVQMLLNIAAYGFYRFRRTVAAYRLGTAAQAGAIASIFRLFRFAEEGHVLAAGPPGRAGRPAIHASRRHGKNEVTILAGITGQNGLPVQALLVFVVALVAGGHFVRFSLVEYLIGGHNDESLRRSPLVDHPDLAVKATFLRYAGAFETQDSDRFPVSGSQFSAMLMTKDSTPAAPSSEIVATYIDHDLKVQDSNLTTEWQNASPVTFSSDWQGKNADPRRETQVRILWSRHYLYLRFECHYHELFVFEDSDPNGRRDHLWDRDVAEAFLQPDPSRERFYREFEVSPNGMWVDLDIFPGGLADLKSGLQRSVVRDEKSQVWTAELAIPIASLTTNFDPTAIWRANFYRVEGKTEPRAYLAWQPTNTPQPNFHVPKAFGKLRFAGGPAN
jgi:Carbohydrate family 9 binding domain-like